MEEKTDSISFHERHPLFLSRFTSEYLSYGFLLILVLAMFGDTLFASDWSVPSQIGTDISIFFAPWRQFGFDELSRGHLTLWNPYLHSGSPFFGDFQSALLYPLNWIYMVIRLPKAINLEIAFHVFLAGVGVHLWARRKGMSRFAAFLTSSLFMFGEPYFAHVSAGHLSLIGSAAWTPFLFLVVDELIEFPRARWILSGIGIVTLQILAGHPQTVFYSGIAALLYFLLNALNVKGFEKASVSFVAIYLGATLISAVQLLAGFHAGSESTRGGGGLSHDAAAFLSFPPENFVTLLAPWFFGLSNVSPEAPHMIYWGGFFNWEVTLFFGISGLVLAVVGAIGGNNPWTRKGSIMVFALVILGLGSNTPLFALLHRWFPGFNRFRASSRFMIQASLFWSMLAGFGFDRLRAQRRINLVPAVIFLILGMFALGFGLAVHHSGELGASGFWGRFVIPRFPAEISHFPSRLWQMENFIKATSAFSSNGLLICGSTLLVLALLFFFLRYNAKAIYWIGMLAVAEVFVSSALARSKFDLHPIVYPKSLINLRQSNPGPFRILYSGDYPNSPMSAGLFSFGASNPQISRRYNEFLYFAQSLNLTDTLRLEAMLRCQFICREEEGRDDLRRSPFEPLPRLQLIGETRIVKGRDAIFATLENPSFDPRREVVLESAPDPEPEAAESDGTVAITDSGTDYLVVEGVVARAALLLITDAYSNGWRAYGLPGSARKKYEIMPANYVLRAIPLPAGKHRIRIEFSPLPYRIGKWISIISVAGYACVLCWQFRTARHSSKPRIDPTPPPQ